MGIMGVIESWIHGDVETSRRKCSAAGSKVESTERSCKNFLADEPVLRDLLHGISTEHDLFEVVCTINRLVFFYVIVRWVNLELRISS